MEQTKTQKIKLGLFVVSSTIILIIALYYIGSKQNFFGNTVRITAVFKNVNGLMLGNNVRFSGINVGTVKKIDMKNDTTICVDMAIQKTILKHLKKNVLASIGSDGLVGSMVVNILPIHENAAPLIAGDTIQSILKISTDDMIATLNKTNDNASLLTLDLLKITKKINEGVGTIGTLISDETMANDLVNTMQNLKVASINANNTIHELNRIVGKVKYDESLAAVILSDPEVAGKMKKLIDNLESSGKGINKMVINLNDLVQEVQTGKGTANYLLKDTAFVQHIDGTIRNIEQSSIKLNENLDALKHSILFRKYFRKLENKKSK